MKKLISAAVAVILAVMLTMTAGLAASARDYAAQTPNESAKTEKPVASGAATVIACPLSEEDIISAKQGNALELWLYIGDISKFKEVYFEVSSSGTFNGACVRYIMNASNSLGQLVNGWNKVQYILHNSSGLSTTAGDAKSKSFNTRYNLYLGGGMTGNVDYTAINYLRLVANSNADTVIGFAGANLNDAVKLVTNPDTKYNVGTGTSTENSGGEGSVSSKGGYTLTGSTISSETSDTMASSLISSAVESQNSAVQDNAGDKDGIDWYWFLIIGVIVVAAAAVVVVVLVRKKQSADSTTADKK